MILLCLFKILIEKNDLNLINLKYLNNYNYVNDLI